MKKYNLLKVICIAILVTLVLSWVLPTTYYSYGLVEDTRAQIGLFDILNYPTVSISYFGNVAVYLLVIGGFYGILNKTGTYRVTLDAIVKKSKGKEKILLSLIMIILAALTSICGASLGLWFVIPFIISLVLLMGYDKITAALVTVGSIVVGLIGTTLSSTYIVDQYNVSAQNGMGIVNSILNTTAFDLIIAKVVILILGLILLIFNTLRYANKTKNLKETKNNDISSNVEKTSRTWPLILIFDLVFIITILSLTSWTSVFKLNWFSSITDILMSKLQIAGFPIIGKILGNVSAFENWTIAEISVMLILASIILSLFYKIKLNDFIDSFYSGAKKALKPAIFIVLIYVVLIMVSYHPFVLTIVKPLLSKTLNVFTMSLSAFITSIFNVDMYYAVSSTLPYVTELITDTSVYPLIALIWQVMYGFMMLVAPTSIILIPVLSYLDISYGKWFKASWKFILEILSLCLIVITVVMLII